MRPCGTVREHPMDNKRRYLNSRMSHEDLREERRDKQAARAEGRADIARQCAAAEGEPVSAGPCETEAPCAVTGKPCRWLSDDETDAAGEIVARDLFCADCARFRDWSKDEMPESTKEGT